jgi:hypothetical protein
VSRCTAAASTRGGARPEASPSAYCSRSDDERRDPIADDQALVRVGLRKILDSEPETTVVGEATDGEDAVALARESARRPQKTHVARILQKLELRDRVQAVIYAYESGLLTPGAG